MKRARSITPHQATTPALRAMRTPPSAFFVAGDVPQLLEGMKRPGRKLEQILVSLWTATRPGDLVVMKRGRKYSVEKHAFDGRGGFCMGKIIGTVWSFE